MTSRKAQTAKRSLQQLVGKPILLKHRHEAEPQGPYTLIGVDEPYIGILKPDTDRAFWFHNHLIDTITEVTPSEQQ